MTWDCISQCYDGSRNMPGKSSGLSELSTILFRFVIQASRGPELHYIMQFTYMKCRKMNFD